jgi:acyl carrier protein
MNSNSSGVAEFFTLNEIDAQSVRRNVSNRDTQQTPNNIEPAAAAAVRDTTLEIAKRVLQAAHIDTGRALVDYGLDSIRATELVVEIENTFHIEISDEQTVRLLTVDDIAEHVIDNCVHTQRII